MHGFGKRGEGGAQEKRHREGGGLAASAVALMPLGAQPYRRTGRHPEANAVRLPVISAFSCFISR